MIARLSIRTMLCLLVCGFSATACVRRTMIITTEPPQALVFLNDQEVGRSEVTTDFLWYGDCRMLQQSHSQSYSGPFYMKCGDFSVNWKSPGLAQAKGTAYVGKFTGSIIIGNPKKRIPYLAVARRFTRAECDCPGARSLRSGRRLSKCGGAGLHAAEARRRSELARLSALPAGRARSRAPQRL